MSYEMLADLAGMPTIEHADDQRVTEKDFASTGPESSSKGLFVYYCTLCGEYCLILGFPLEAFPSRSTGDFVVETAVHLKKHALFKGESVNIKREEGIEKQYRLHCGTCGVPVAYQCDAFPAIPKVLYVFPSALTRSPQEVQAAIEAREIPIPRCILLSDDGKSGRFPVKPIPGARESNILNITDSIIEIELNAPSKESLMNAELIRYIALLLDASDAQLSLDWDGKSLIVVYEGGKDSPRKITNVFVRELSARLRREAQPSASGKQ